MATSDKSVKVTVTANVVPYKKGMADASAATTKLGGDIDKVAAKSKGLETGFGKASGALKGLALGGAAIAGTALVSFLGDSVKAAGDLQQSIGGVDSVFKESAQSIHDFGQNSAQAVGLSTNEFNQLITVTGAMLKNKGLEDFSQKSLDLVKVGADLAAQFGGSTKDAVDALNAAMRGESDPIERYGISLNETAVNAELAKKGLTGLTGAALDQAKAAARIDIITRQSADAMGAFSREADTLQGQQQRLNAEWENAQAQLGNALLPALTSVTEALRGGLNAATAVQGAWEQIPGPVKSAAAALIVYRLAQDRIEAGGAAVVGTVKSLGEALGFARQSAERAGGGLAGLNAGFKTFTGTAGAGAAAMKGLKGAGSSLMALAGGPWGVAIGGLTFLFADFFEELQKGQAQVDAIRNGLADLAKAGDSTPEKKLDKFFSIFKDDLPKIREQLAKAGVSWEQYTSAIANGGQPLTDVENRLRLAGTQAGIFGDHLGTTIDITHRWNAEQKDAAKLGQDQATALKKVATSAGEAAPNVDTLAIKTALANDAAKAAAESHKDLAKAILEVSDAAVDADKAESDWQKAIDDATASLKENGKTANKAKDALNLTTEAGRANQDALIGLRDAAIKNAEAMLTTGDSADKVKDKMGKARDEFVKVAEKMGLSKDAANKLADEYGLTRDSVDKLKASMDLIPKQVKSSIEVGTAAAKTAIAGIEAMLKAVDRDRLINVTVRRLGVDPGDFVGGRGGTRFATGGSVLGPGSGTSDSIPAWLSNGEYVVKAAAVAKYGTRFFDQLNTMRLAEGGFVSRMPQRVAVSNPAAAASGGTTYIAQGLDVDDALQKLDRQREWKARAR